MKIMFAIKKLDEMAGGAERVLCVIATELAERGHNVTVLTFDAPGGRPFYDIGPGIERIDLGIGDSSRPTHTLETLKRIRSLRHEIGVHSPDIAIGFTPSMYVPMAFALAGTGIKVVGSEHNVPERYARRSLQMKLIIAASPLMHKMTVLSETIRKRYPSPVRKKMEPLTNPVPPIPKGRESDRSERQEVILNVGRMTEQKDQETLLRAFASLSEVFPRWSLRILGDGPLRGHLEKLAGRLGVADRVQMPGVTRDIHGEYERAGLFALSSRYESFGLVTVEAMQHGLPTVAFADCPGTNEFLVNGENALLAANTPSRVESLAECLKTLMADVNLRDKLGDRGQKSITGKFEISAICTQWEDFLQETAKVVA